MAAPVRTPIFWLGLALVASTGCRDKIASFAPPLADIAPAHAATPKRAFDSWPSYGHDPGRTGATRDRCEGPLRLLWRFTPPSSAVATHAIAVKDAVYVSARIGVSPALYRVSLSGELGWSFNSHADVTLARWPDAALGRVILNDDGFFWFMPKTGKRVGPRWLDLWGQTLSDGRQLFAVNEMHLDGPGVFVGAFNRSAKSLWKANHYVARRGRFDVIGAMALDGGTLYQAARFQGAVLSGLYALDPATGARRWAERVYPDSSLSAQHGRLFLVEMNWSKKRTLFARSEQDGSVLWSVAVADTDHQAPVIAGDRVVTYGPASGIVARDVHSGRALWKTELSAPGKKRPGYATTLAAALGSHTLVAAAGSELAVLSLKNGRILWRGAESDLTELNSPIIAGGRVYVVAHGSVLALACSSSSAARPARPRRSAARAALPNPFARSEN